MKLEEWIRIYFTEEIIKILKINNEKEWTEQSKTDPKSKGDYRDVITLYKIRKHKEPVFNKAVDYIKAFIFTEEEKIIGASNTTINNIQKGIADTDFEKCKEIIQQKIDENTSKKQALENKNTTLSNENEN